MGHSCPTATPFSKMTRDRLRGSLGRNEHRGESDMKPNLCLSARRWIGAVAALSVLSSMPAFAADKINGQVWAAGGPVAGSTVTLWAAGADAPRQLAQTRTGPDGRPTRRQQGERRQSCPCADYRARQQAAGPRGSQRDDNRGLSVDP